MSRQNAYDKINKVQETDMEMAIKMENMIAQYRQNLYKAMTFDQKMNEKFVEEKMKPIYDTIVWMKWKK